jgi:hypothetical protein
VLRGDKTAFIEEAHRVPPAMAKLVRMGTNWDAERVLATQEATENPA